MAGFSVPVRGARSLPGGGPPVAEISRRRSRSDRLRRKSSLATRERAQLGIGRAIEAASGRVHSPLRRRRRFPASAGDVLDEAVPVGQDDGGELGVHVELVKDALDVVADSYGRDEELLRDRRRPHSFREAP